MVANLFAPNSSLGEQIEGAYMPSWALLGMTVVEKGLERETTKLLTRNKLKQTKTMSIWKNEK
jgi:hypothetical protein